MEKRPPSRPSANKRMRDELVNSLMASAPCRGGQRIEECANGPGANAKLRGRLVNDSERRTPVDWSVTGLEPFISLETFDADRLCTGRQSSTPAARGSQFAEDVLSGVHAAS